MKSDIGLTACRPPDRQLVSAYTWPDKKGAKRGVLRAMGLAGKVG
jgi:hypothetical protein